MEMTLIDDYMKAGKVKLTVQGSQRGEVIELG